MQTFNGTLEVQVEQGTVAATKSLLFDLVGEGTLPHVSIEKPAARSEAGVPLLQFPRLLLERSAKQPLVLRNEGILPATVRVTLPRGTPFSCSASGQLIAIEPHSSHTLDVAFTAGVPGEALATLNLSVLKNAFEDQTVELRGLAYAQDVAIEDLPAADEGEEADVEANQADNLKFGDVAMGQSKTISFTLRNLSNTARKFSWQSVEGLTFSPSVGHLLPKSAKTVTATFAPTEATAHEAAPACLELTRIQYTAEYDDWDDSMKVVKYLTEEEFQAREQRMVAEAEAAAAAKAEAEEAARLAAEEAEAAASKGKKGKDKGKAAPPPEPEPEPEPEPAAPAAEEEDTEPKAPASPGGRRRKVIDTEPEPEHEVLPPPEPAEGEEPAAAEPPLTLLVSGKCEYGVLECETSTLAFRPTMMFQARYLVITPSSTCTCHAHTMHLPTWP